MSDSPRCSVCGAALPTPGSSCSACLLGVGLAQPGPQPLGPGFLDDLPLTDRQSLIARKYRVLDVLGRGGMGVVYRAYQENLERVVALKMISSGAHASAEERERFLREARVAGRLQHPGIVAIHDWGEDEGVPFFSMEFVQGRNLAEVVRESGPMEARRAARLMRSAAQAVAYAHRENVLHRDLKPQNLLLTGQDEVKVTDFGLAKSLDLDPTFTATGQVLGTASYMAPEQERGAGTAGRAADVYGLGAVLYHLLTGRPPFVGNALGDVLAQVRHEDPIPPCRLNQGVPVDLESICLRCLEKEPSRRYASAEDLAEDLHRFHNGEPVHARPVSNWRRGLRWARRKPVISSLAAALLVTVLAGLLLVVWQWRRAEAARARAEATRDQLEVQHANQLLTDADGTEGVAYLASILARNPGNAVARTRLLAAIASRPYAHPVAPGLALDGSAWAVACGEGDRFVMGEYTDRVHLWNPGSDSPRTIRRDGFRVLDVAAVGDESLVAWLPSAHAIHVEDVSAASNAVRRLEHPAAVEAARFSARASRLVARIRDGSSLAWRLDRNPLPPPTALAHQEGATDVAFTPDEGRLVIGHPAGRLEVWDLDSGRLLAARDLPNAGPEAVVCSPDGQRIAVMFRDGSARQFRLSDLETMGGTMQHEGGTTSISYSPDAGRLVTTSWDKTARLWRAATGTPLGQPLRHRGGVLRAEFSPDGLKVASASYDRTVRVWDSLTGAELCEPLRHSQLPGHPRFGSSGILLLTEDASLVQVWALPEWRVQPAWRPHVLLFPHTPMNADMRSVTISWIRGASVREVSGTNHALRPLQHVEDQPSRQFSSDGRYQARIAPDPAQVLLYDHHSGWKAPDQGAAPRRLGFLG